MCLKLKYFFLKYITMATLGKSRHMEKEGNTVTSFSKKQPTRKTFYTFTLFNYEPIEEEFNRQLKSICRKYLYGHEICPNTNRTHLQGFLHLNKAMRITELNLIGKPHLECCRGDEEQNINYCSKENNNIIKYGFPKELKLISPNLPWQLEILDIIKGEPNDRHVYWYWSSNGGVGKSQFCKYLVALHNCVFIDEGKKADIMYSIMEADMDKCNTVIFDVPRGNGNKISYKSVESIKNGMIYSPKYESKYKLFNSPHIIVFANEAPQLEQLSIDRWIVKEIS